MNLEEVPHDLIPPGQLPAMGSKDLPEPLPLRKMIGPSIMLAGLALGSGEFILWPYITYKSQFVFFWACMLGVTTQYFINMEITRWTLATGESVVTGFARLSKHWAWVFLFLNIVPWILPAWAKGAAQVISWLAWPPELAATEDGLGLVVSHERFVTPLAIGGMVMCGVVLTAGPVIYETVERIQKFLISFILILVVVLAVWLVRADSVTAMVTSTVTLGYPDFVPDFIDPIDSAFLLGAIAFAGAGGTLNLGQSNYIKDKGYGMGKYIGRITSPITGQVEAISEIGNQFPMTSENLSRWRRWWQTASREHLLSFFATCVICLVLLTLISHSLFYTPDGQLLSGVEKYGEKMNFVLGEATEIGTRINPIARIMFLIMGVAILLTTELGVLDAASRISTDIVKVNWLRGNPDWTERRLYYLFLWGTIAIGSGVLLLNTFGLDVSALTLFKLTAAMNGAVMFLYSGILIWLNTRTLPAAIRMSRPRLLAMIWAVLFFGFFAVWAAGAVVRSIMEG